MKKPIPTLLIAAMALTFQASVSNAETVPSFLQGIDAAPLTQSEMENVRGEAIPAIVVIAAARAAPSFVRFAANVVSRHGWMPGGYLLDMWNRYGG